MPVDKFLAQYMTDDEAPTTVQWTNIDDPDSDAPWLARDIIEKLGQENRILEANDRALYVLDETHRLKGIITLTDVLKTCRRWRIHPPPKPVLSLPYDNETALDKCGELGMGMGMGMGMVTVMVMVMDQCGELAKAIGMGMGMGNEIGL